jgi:hypothetical protein
LVSPVGSAGARPRLARICDGRSSTIAGDTTRAAHGAAEPSIRSVVATGFATYRRRCESSCVAAVLVFVPFDLLAVVGPVIAIEDLAVWGAIKRSAGLTGRHLLPVVVTALLPTTLDESLSSVLESLSWHEHVWLRPPADVGSTIIVGGAVGVLEATVAHALIADRRRFERSRSAAADVTRRDSDGRPAQAETAASQAADR